MIVKFLIPLLLLIATFNADVYGQTFGWSKSLNGKSWVLANDICTDIYGDIIVVGRFVDTADFDPNEGEEIRTTPDVSDLGHFYCKIRSVG